MMNFEFEDKKKRHARIMVVGVGGGGGNAVNRMARGNLTSVELLAANTDNVVLQQSLAPTTLLIGADLTHGWGAGADPEIGCLSAENEVDRIVEFLYGVDMVFLTAGMGGGTGTGAAPVFGRIAMEMGILTVGIVTKPFFFEGHKRMEVAEEGIERLKENVDTLIIISNQNLLRAVEKKTPLADSFQMVDEILYQAVKGISDLITVPGLINLDFADVKSVMYRQGTALIGVGTASGDGRASECIRKAIMSPLLSDMPIEGARGILVNLTGGSSMKLCEVNEILSHMHEKADPDANIIMGAVVQEDMDDELAVTLIATGFPEVQNEDELCPSLAGSTGTRNMHKPSLRQYRKTPAKIISMPKVRNMTDFDKLDKLDDVGEPGPNNPLPDDLDIPAFMRKKTKQ